MCDRLQKRWTEFCQLKQALCYVPAHEHAEHLDSILTGNVIGGDNNNSSGKQYFS